MTGNREMVPAAGQTEVLTWLRELVRVEFVELVGMTLRGMPGGKVEVKGRDGKMREFYSIDLTRQAWVNSIITHYRELDPGDTKRLHEGFSELRTRINYWPQPVQLWTCVPEREEDPEVIDQRFQRELARRKDVEDRLDNPPAKPIKLLEAPEGMKRPDREERDKAQRVATLGQINRLINILNGKEGAA